MKVITSSPDPFNGPYSRFLETYSGPPITIYTESVDTPTWTDKAEILPLEQVDGLAWFLRLIDGIPACRGHWQFDVERFCKKSFCWFDAARNASGNLFWFDSDIEWKAPISEARLDALLGDADMCYLGRENYHPCTSFVGWNLDRAQPFMRAFEKLYTSTMFLRLAEWHDAYLVGELLKETPPTFHARNLTPNGKPVENVFDSVFTEGHHSKGPGKFH